MIPFIVDPHEPWVELEDTKLNHEEIYIYVPTSYDIKQYGDRRVACLKGTFVSDRRVFDEWLQRCQQVTGKRHWMHNAYGYRTAKFRTRHHKIILPLCIRDVDTDEDLDYWKGKWDPIMRKNIQPRKTVDLWDILEKATANMGDEIGGEMDPGPIPENPYLAEDPIPNFPSIPTIDVTEWSDFLGLKTSTYPTPIGAEQPKGFTGLKSLKLGNEDLSSINFTQKLTDKIGKISIKDTANTLIEDKGKIFGALAGFLSAEKIERVFRKIIEWIWIPYRNKWELTVWVVKFVPKILIGAALFATTANVMALVKISGLILQFAFVATRFLIVDVGKLFRKPLRFVDNAVKKLHNIIWKPLISVLRKISGALATIVKAVLRVLYSLATFEVIRWLMLNNDFLYNLAQSYVDRGIKT